jgi:uncharacterized RDD family membrane protein YckC
MEKIQRAKGKAMYNAHETERMIALHGSELARFPRRAGSFLLDIAFASGLFVIVSSLLEPFLINQGWIKSDQDIVFALNMNWYSIAWTVIYFSLALFIGNGKSPGKWIFGIRVVSIVHNNISFWHSIERAFGYGFSLMECCFGFIQYFIYPNRRTLHDRIAETIVIRERKKKI